MRTTRFQRRKSLTFALIATGFLFLTLLPCDAETIVALYSNKRVRYFDSESPATFSKTLDLSGIPEAEAVVAMDFRPAGQLFVLTRESGTVRFYEVDQNTGAATRGAASSTGWDAGSSFGFDFVPPLVANGVGDGVLVSDAAHFQRISPSGANSPVTAAYDNDPNDGDPVDEHAGQSPDIVALACTNNFPEARSTILYGIDATTDSLVIIDRSTGRIDTVAQLGATTGLRCGFDISGTTGIAYAALSPTLGDATTLYTVDLANGRTTSLGLIGGQIQQTGVHVVDISVLPATRLVNISTRTRVGTGEDVMIAGFTTVGGASSRLIIRGLGPSLAAFGISSPLPNPYLTIFDANGAVATNDNWKSDQQTEIYGSKLAPTNDLEAAFIGTFAPGAYTAVLRDANNASGVGVIEVYKLADQ